MEEETITNFGDILEAEKQMVLNAEKKYGKYFQNAFQFNELIQHFIKSIEPQGYFFAIFHSQIKKHITLALFSSVRRHHVQTQHNLRYVLESGVWASYAIRKQLTGDKLGEGIFFEYDDQNYLKVPKKLGNKARKWLEYEFPKHNLAIKNMKDIINKSCSHSDLIPAFMHFKLNKSDNFEMTFFDFDDDYFVKVDLWQIANISMGLLDLFNEVNKKYKCFNFHSNFEENLIELEKINHEIKNEMMNNHRYKKHSRK